MNHIARLTADRDASQATLAASRDELGELISYLASDKFAGADSDYVHIRTDLMPRLLRLRSCMLEA